MLIISVCLSVFIWLEMMIRSISSIRYEQINKLMTYSKKKAPSNKRKLNRNMCLIQGCCSCVRLSATLRSIIQSKQTIQLWACTGMHELGEIHESKSVPQWNRCLRGALAVSQDRIAIWWNTRCDIHKSQMEKNRTTMSSILCVLNISNPREWYRECRIRNRIISEKNNVYWICFGIESIKGL